MASHEEIERRSLRLAEEVARRIDLDPTLLEKARAWARAQSAQGVVEWREILEKPWPAVRKVLLDEGEEGRRLRQSSPFAGILTPRERWTVYRDTPST